MQDLQTVISSTPEFVNGATKVEKVMVSSEISKPTLGAIGTVGEAIKPFIPLIAVVTRVIDEIIEIYENVEYNKRICNALMDRIQIADRAIKNLNRRKQENGKNFCNREYYLSFIKFTHLMRKIRNFIRDVSQLQSYKNLHSDLIKDEFNNLVNNFDIVTKDLNFTKIITNEEQHKIDQQAFTEDIVEMTE